jgi:hypothetical protein
MDKSEFNDQQIEHLIQSSLFNDAAQVSPENGTFFAIQDRLGEQKGPGMRQRVSDSLDNLSEAIWRIIPVSKQRMAQALVLVAIAVVVGSYVAFAGSDGDGVDSGSAAEATSAPKSTAEPAVPESTPIAKIMVPDDLAPFNELLPFPVWGEWADGGEAFKALGSLPKGASAKLANTKRLQQMNNELFGGNRMLLLIYAPGVNPMETPLFDQEIDDADPGGIPEGTWNYSVENPEVIIVEEFAFCGDGRGVYLQHTDKPGEVGETFAWEIYATETDPVSDLHLVLSAEPDSPITHAGPDPKRLDLQFTIDEWVLSADVGVTLIGMFSTDPDVREMCKN